MYPCVFITFGGTEGYLYKGTKLGLDLKCEERAESPWFVGLSPSWPPAPNPHIPKLTNLGNQNLKAE